MEHFRTTANCSVRTASAQRRGHRVISPSAQSVLGGAERSSSANNVPQSVLEQTLVSIWQEVLQRESVGLFENFFDLGGHSFLVLQVHSKLSAQLHLKLPITDLFNYPTISALTEHLASQQPARNMTVLAGQDHASSRKAAMQRHQRTRSQL